MDDLGVPLCQEATIFQLAIGFQSKRWTDTATEPWWSHAQSLFQEGNLLFAVGLNFPVAFYDT